jgi:hypothetical protein
MAACGFFIGDAVLDPQIVPGVISVPDAHTRVNNTCMRATGWDVTLLSHVLFSLE